MAHEDRKPKLALVLALMAAAFVTLHGTLEAQTAYDRAVHVNETIRIVPLTGSMVCVQVKGEDGKWPMEITHGVRKRDFPPVEFEVEKADGRVTVKTAEGVELSIAETGDFDSVRATFNVNGTGFAIENLRAEDRENFGGWRHGVDMAFTDSISVGIDGTRRKPWQPTSPGLLSRRGWTVFSHVDGLLRAGVHKETDELFLLAYGHDYRRCWRDFFALAGPTPLVPRWFFGVIYGQFDWRLTEKDYRAIIPRWREEISPLDGIGIVHFSEPGANGRVIDEDALDVTDLPTFLAWCKKQRIDTYYDNFLNVLDPKPPIIQKFLVEAGILDAQVLDPETSDDETMKMIRRDTKLQGNRIRMGEYLLDDEIWEVYKEYWHEQDARLGWSSTQLDTRGNPGILHEKYFNAWAAIAGIRPSVITFCDVQEDSFARHRSQIKFGGDIWSAWGSQRQTIPFTMQHGLHGNVMSICTGGFKAMKESVARKAREQITREEVAYILPDEMRHGELYARSMQWGAVCPILRLVGSMGGGADKELTARLPWRWEPEACESAARAFRLRYRLLPYIYTAARQWHDTGVPLMRPMWLEYPEEEEACNRELQYFFGDNLLASPIVHRSEEDTPWIGHKETWFPEGVWVDYFTGERIEGPCVKTINKGINEFPLYIKEGAVIPCGDYEESSKEPLDKLILDVATPQSDMKTTARLYEDDGISREYRDKNHRWTTIRLHREGDKIALLVKAVEGEYAGAPMKRSYEIRLRNVDSAPQECRLNGEAMKGATLAPANKTLVITTPILSVERDTRVEIRL